MKIYFIYESDKQLGPFTPHELKDRGITTETPVWREGLNTWVKAGEVEELKNYTVKFPPPFEGVAPAKGSILSQKKIIIWLSLALIVAITAIVGYRYWSENQKNDQTGLSNERTSEELKNDLVTSEPENAVQYLKIPDANMHNNLIGRKIIKGVVINSSASKSFKDIKVGVTFLSKTETELQRKVFTLYEYLEPGNSLKFREVLDAPDGTEEFKIEVLGATETGKN